MGQVILPKDVLGISRQIKSAGKTIVIAGGCFDILHLGHIQFLKKAKALADVLIVFLESDEKITIKKGPGRPVNPQKVRAEILAAFEGIDYVVLLPLMKNEEYDELVIRIKPEFIATTKGDLKIHHKERAAELSGAKIKFVMSLLKGYSTGIVVEKLLNEG